VIHRGILEGKADFYYLRQGIGGIRELFAVERAHRRVQRAIIAYSIGYNLLAAGLAMAGRVNPLVAAVLMPSSSLLSLAIVTLGLRGRIPGEISSSRNLSRDPSGVIVPDHGVEKARLGADGGVRPDASGSYHPVVP